MISQELLDLLRCPNDPSHTRLEAAADGLVCQRCRLKFPQESNVCFVCGAALIQAVTVGVVYAGLTVLWGLLIAIWALLTRVRRRMYAGVGLASLGILLTIAVPLARLVPYVTGVALWGTLAGLGAAFLIVATTLEQSRARLGAALHHAGELMETWE